MNKESRLKGDQREQLARRAARAAIKLRMQLSALSAASLCSVDAAENLGIELRLVDIPSMEGMYVKNSGPETKSIILVSALRPAGRQASTAAHELGHHVFGHGTRIDQYIRDLDESSPSCPDSEEEFHANAFAAFLMPKSAVDQGFRVRGYAPFSADTRQRVRQLNNNVSSLLQDEIGTAQNV
jgi:Zn-dependent peptidase ImmA (M78 family)